MMPATSRSSDEMQSAAAGNNAMKAEALVRGLATSFDRRTTERVGTRVECIAYSFELTHVVCVGQPMPILIQDAFVVRSSMELPESTAGAPPQTETACVRQDQTFPLIRRSKEGVWT